jgi:uncharacterized protein YaaN involved in tellurite resistance
MRADNNQAENKSEEKAIEGEVINLVPAGEPKPPKGMSDEEATKLKNQAAEMVRQLEQASGSKELSVVDSMSNVGLQTQRAAASNLRLLEARVATLLNSGGPGREIGNSLRDLRITLDQIDPAQNPRTFWDRAYNVFPFFGGRNPVRILQKIAMKYEPVSRQVIRIELRLKEGQQVLEKDNGELIKLYQQVEVQQPQVEKNAYMGELLMQELARLLAHTPDGVLHDVAMRVQDLRTMDEVHIQYFVSIEMTRQNNKRLEQALERTLTLTNNALTVGLAIQSALVDQKAVMEATKRTRELLGTLITANAAAIKRHTQEIGNLYNNPVIAMDKVTQAHNDLMEAMDMADRLRQDGINIAQDNIKKLRELSDELTQRATGLLQDDSGQPPEQKQM